MSSRKKYLVLVFFLSSLISHPSSLIWAAAEQQQASKDGKAQAKPKKAAIQDTAGQAWDEANAAISEVYYSEALEKNPDAAMKTQWQGAFGLVYKTLDIMRKGTHPSQGVGGEGVEPMVLLPYYTETHGQLRNALDQMYVTKGVASSLEGRGRTLLPQLELFYQQIELARIALAERNYMGYDRTFLSLCYMAKTMQAAFNASPPPKYSDVVKPFPKKEVVEALSSGAKFVMMVTAAIFAGVFLFVRLPQFGVNEALLSFVEKRKEKMKQLAYEYNRQFLGVGAGWLLYGPMVVSVIFGLMTMNLFVFAMALFLFGYLLPTEGLKFVKERRQLRIEGQLLDAMILLSDAMKSGLDLIQGMELAVHEMVPPISEEFDLLIRNYKLGTPFEDALKAMDTRIDSDLVNYVVRAIIIQRHTGGNLTKIFDRIVDTIREESKLKDKINALTAGPRMQSMVISVIPWGMLLVLYFFQPDAVGSFFVSLTGILVLLACVFWQTIGLIVIRKLAKIEV